MPIQEEIRFNESKKKFEESFKKIQEAINAYNNAWRAIDLERIGINDEDYERLDQFVNSIQKGIPKRDYISFENISRTSTQEDNIPSGELVVNDERRNFFANLTQFIRNIFSRITNRKDEPIVENIDFEEMSSEEVSDEETITEESLNYDYEDEYESQRQPTYNVDELIQECNKAYEELIRCSGELDDFYEKRLDESPKGRVIDTKHDGPGILDDYRQGSWGIERICLDGFQNHLPADSKGTRCYLHFLVGDKWVDCETAKLHRDKIKAVRFADNGVGFTSDNLFYLHSTKTSEDTSAGQFGEGMKLASIAAVNLGLGLEFQSRNWIAIAGSEEKKIVNTRNNDTEETRKKLVYDVEEYDGEPIKRF